MLLNVDFNADPDPDITLIRIRIQLPKIVQIGSGSATLAAGMVRGTSSFLDGRKCTTCCSHFCYLCGTSSPSLVPARHPVPEGEKEDFSSTYYDNDIFMFPHISCQSGFCRVLLVALMFLYVLRVRKSEEL
jgi:hypothetical protein